MILNAQVRISFEEPNLKNEQQGFTLIERMFAVAIIGIVAPLCANDVNAQSLGEEQNCLALSIYWEARGEIRRGMIAVGWTVLNRMQSEHFPSTPCDVVHQGGEQGPCQFSWWCDGKSDRPRDRDSWTAALLLSAKLLVDPPPDPTGGALFYHSVYIPLPWRRQRIRTTQIGGHVFYR